MAKELKGWQCDNCGKVHPTKELAEECERKHEARMEGVEITHANFSIPERSDHFKSTMGKMFPETIHIKFSEQHGDFARYRLEHIGFVGL